MLFPQLILAIIISPWECARIHSLSKRVAKHRSATAAVADREYATVGNNSGDRAVSVVHLHGGGIGVRLMDLLHTAMDAVGLAGDASDTAQAGGMMLMGSAHRLKEAERFAHLQGTVNFMGWAGLAAAGYEVASAMSDLDQAFANGANGCEKTVKGTRLALAAGGLGVGLLAQFALNNHSGVVAGGISVGIEKRFGMRQRTH